MSFVREGDAEAFAVLSDRHSRAAYSLAYRMMGEHQAAEDLVQDAFLKVWRAAASYRDRKSTRLNSSHANISYAVFCLQKKKHQSDAYLPTYVEKYCSSFFAYPTGP